MKTPEEIEKSAEEWMKGKELYATYDAHITGFIKGYTQCQQDNFVELLKWVETQVFYSDPNDGALISYDVLVDKIKSLNKKD
jgi:hypothetical protein